METQLDLRQQRIRDAAREYVAMGLPIIPLRGKIPAVTGWRRFTVESEQVDTWFGSGDRRNIGLRTGGQESGYIVIDTDTEEAEQWVLKHCPDTPMHALSGAGSHHRFFAEPAGVEIRNRQA